MKIKFLRPVAGFAYWENDIADNLPEEKAASLVAKGFAVLVPETEGNENNLPEDLPARELLFAEGLETITDIRNAVNTLTDINGIGKTTAQKIKKFIAED